jgi:uncharacterized protein YndB with AHSA1/START domain
VSGPSLRLTRLLRAPPARVFAAWTDPALLAQWFGPHQTHVEAAEVGLHVGGGFRVVIVEDADVRAGQGSRHAACGTFREITPPSRLVLDWWWEAAPERVSRVTVTLRAVPDGTELTLQHDRFADEATASRHVRGWTESLDRLVALAHEGAMP